MSRFSVKIKCPVENTSSQLPIHDECDSQVPIARKLRIYISFIYGTQLLICFPFGVDKARKPSSTARTILQRR